MWIVWNRNDEGLHQYYCDVGWDDLARVVCEVDTGKCKLVYLSTYEFIPQAKKNKIKNCLGFCKGLAFFHILSIENTTS